MWHNGSCIAVDFTGQRRHVYTASGGQLFQHEAYDPAIGWCRYLRVLLP